MKGDGEKAAAGGSVSSSKEMDASVSPSNPYSRLMALKKMGIVKNYGDIRVKTVLVIGIGGIGSSTCEMLCRLGIGKLIVFDYDIVELCNMNRLFYLPMHCEKKMYKVDAAKEMLSSINSDVEIETHNCNINTNTQLLVNRIFWGKDKFTGTIDVDANNEKNTISKVDIVLSCVDNYASRITISSLCTKYDIVWFNTGVSESSMNGQIQLCVPGYNACYQCAPPSLVADDDNNGQKVTASTDNDADMDKINRIRELEKSIKREGVCTASLPTTMCMIASLLVQNVLKYLLSFGTVNTYVNYNVYDDFFMNYNIMCNNECTDDYCKIRQREWLVNNRKFKNSVGNTGDSNSGNDSNEEIVLHETNEYNICVNVEGYNSRDCDTTEVRNNENRKALMPEKLKNCDDLDELQKQLNNL